MTPIGSEKELEQIIKNRSLNAVFQPIFDTAMASIIGYEALTRGPADSSLHSPLMLFQTAARCNQIANLELACREVSCDAFQKLQLPGKLFLNVSPMTLTDPEFTQGMTHLILDKYGIDASNVVIEISEQYPLEGYELIRASTEHYRKQGYEIAIDDLGAGYAGLRVWSELRPDYVKIDRHFIENIHQDRVKWEFVRSIHEIAKTIGSKVIAEGVEVEEELRTIESIGIHLSQGYYLGRPHAHPSIELPTQLAERNKQAFVTGKPQQTVKEVLQSATTIPSDYPITAAVDLFQKDANLSTIPVVDDTRAQGVLSRNQILT
jgi:EAL domain-containing protein (putative c-di-GMP-specific phosphodiesterase class I)